MPTWVDQKIAYERRIADLEAELREANGELRDSELHVAALEQRLAEPLVFADRVTQQPRMEHG